ncbi:MAG: hypothetical protein OQL06_09755 [Gammaproteobacteria bacterium]|nr:hypothetical protein [Gammaproteobacteria bacterium]
MKTLNKWLLEVKESLSKALGIANDSSMPTYNLYMLAPIIYAERQKTNNEALLQEMIDANDKQVSHDWAIDEESRSRFIFHFVSSYLYCFVVADKIDELKYDEIMEYVNDNMDLFPDK